jgi:ATP-dependent DNA helicase RecQ
VTAGWVDFTPGEKPVVVLTGSGRAVMKGERPARLVLPRAHATEPPPMTGTRPAPDTASARPATASEALPAEASSLFEALRRLRSELARAENVPAFVVASDRTLRDIAVLRPRGLATLKLAHGIGPAKAERYGAQILAVVARAGD